MTISNQDRIILRELAKQQRAIARSEKMQALYADWQRHGSFAANSRPMVTIELDTFAGDIVPSLLRCEGQEARAIESRLHRNMINHTLFEDDTLVREYMPFQWDSTFVPFGIDVQVEYAADSKGESLGQHFVPVIEDLEEDFSKIGPSRFFVDKEATQNRMAAYNDILGDILPARLSGRSVNICPTQNLIHIMSMETLFLSMVDYPERFEQMTQMLADDYLAYLKLLEQENVLLPTVAEQHLCQGSYCFTDKLPKEKEMYSTQDVWGYLDSQETSSISPAMYEEFIFPLYQKIAAQFGRVSYGCCEPVHPIWESCIQKLPNVGKVSISPWCDEAFMGGVLRGREIVYLRKPNPNFLGVGSGLDEPGVIEHFEHTVASARGCTLEIAQRDVYHINDTPEKVRRYVQLIRRCCEKHEK